MFAKLLMLTACAGLSFAAGDDAQTVFDALYAKRIRQAKATATRDDDVALAAELLAAAKQSRETPKLLALLCDGAYDLGSGAPPAGYDHAAAAMQLLMEVTPARKATALDKLVEVRHRQYLAASNADDRAAAADPLLDLIDQQAAGAGADGRWNDAVIYYRKALAIAARQSSPRAAAFRDAISAAMRRKSAEERVIALTKQLEADASDQRAMLELVRLYVIDLNDPKRASIFATRLDDAEWKANVELANKPIDTLREAELLTLGEWYRSLADGAGATSKTPLLAHAKDYLESFVRRHDTSDLSGKKAALLLQDVRATLDRAAASGTGAADARPNLLNSVDLTRDVVRGTFKKDRDALVTPSGGRLVLPSTPTGDYEVEFTFKRMGQSGGLVVYLPIGGRTALFTIQVRGEGLGIEGLHGKGLDVNGDAVNVQPIKTDQTHRAVFTVTRDGGAATIKLTFDGQVLYDKKRSIGDFTLHPFWSLGRGPTLAIAPGANFAFRDVFVTEMKPPE